MGQNIINIDSTYSAAVQEFWLADRDGMCDNGQNIRIKKPDAWLLYRVIKV